MLLLQVMTIKTDGKAKYYFKCRMKVDTSVRTFVGTRLASVIFDTRNFKRVNLSAETSKCCLILMHGSILPVTIPPGQPPGQVQPFGPGGGELFEAVLSRGEGGGANRK